MGKEKGKQNGGMRKGHQNGNRSKWEDDSSSSSVTSEGTTTTRRSSKQVAPFTQAVKFGIQFVHTPDTDKISEARAHECATKLMSMDIKDLNDYRTVCH